MTDPQRYEFCACDQCGWFGKISDLKDHSTRPMAMDLGFCPECPVDIEVDFIMTKSIAIEYLRKECDQTDDEIMAVMQISSLE